MNDRQLLGRAGEEFVERYLGSCLGWNIVSRNWRCAAGELDLVAIEHECLVIVEVRTRRGIETGSAVEAVDRKKLRQLYRVIPFFLAAFQPLSQLPLRLDVVALHIEHWTVQELTHVRNALILDLLYS